MSNGYPRLFILQHLVLSEQNVIICNQEHSILSVFLYNILLDINHTRYREDSIVVLSDLIVGDKKLLTVN